MALSYVWGDTNPLRDISVNGKMFGVTANLFYALRDLRDEYRVSRLWLDTICINQQDVEERNKQVVLMGSIYTLAHHTVIYLGEGTVGSNAALEALAGENLSGDKSTDILRHRQLPTCCGPRVIPRLVYKSMGLSRASFITGSLDSMW